jgi:aspartate carbamoyltransferase catalytic subunit
VINAGDGAGEHPTQALVDLFTIKEKKERVEGLNVLIVGDILHSRVARSDIFALSKMGARVRVCGPPTLIPVQIKRMGVEQIFYRLEEALDGVDVVIMLRIQRERQKEQFFPSLQEYINLYSLSTEKLVNAKNDILIMHPGPINRGVELSGDIADGPFSLIQEQVQNGIAVRMAVLYLLAQSR